MGMTVFLLIPVMSILLALIRIILKKKYLLSVLICIERILLKLLVLKFFTTLITGSLYFQNFTLFLLTMSAVEARVGVALLTLVTRRFKTKKINNLKILKTQVKKKKKKKKK